MAASLSPVAQPQPQSQPGQPLPSDMSPGVPGRLRSNSAVHPSPSPDAESLTIRPIQTPALPHQMHHPQPQAALGTGASTSSLQQQQQQQPLPSPGAIENAMQAAIASTPPPRPARAPLRSPNSLPRSPSAPTLSDSPLFRLFTKALENSKDGGETLDLSRERVERITDQDVELFRTRAGKEHNGVWRLALSYNALYDGTIANSFSSLTRLRYLNLKGNHLTVIPPALCDMQGLEILDLSKNQITTLPPRPGRLEYLKVLSLSNNALTTIPTYLAFFNNLKVFKVDHNPIEWPPREILGPLVDAEPVGRKHAPENNEPRTRREEDLRPWIEGMRTWLQEQIDDGNIQPPPTTALALPTDEGYHIGSDEQTASPIATSPTSMAVIAPWTMQEPPAPGSSQPPTMKRLPVAPANGGTGVAGTAMAHSEGTASNEAAHPHPVLASPPKLNFFRHRNRAATISEDSLVHVNNASTLSLPAQGIRHDRSISSSSSLTPPISASTSSSHSGPPSAGFPKPPPPIPTSAGSTSTSTFPSHSSGQPASASPHHPHHPPIPGHNRGGSYTVPHRLSGLTTKKSLPDLRKSHAKIIEERRNERPDGLRIRSPIDIGIEYHRPHPLSNSRKVSTPVTSQAEKVRPLKSMASMEVLQRPKEAAAVERQGSPDAPSLDESRDSYFRRVSMLPPSTISKAVSPAMLMFIDAIRGLLFALTQLHSALREYVNFAVSDRVAGVFARVLEPAGRYLSNLINALDRFDSTSRQSSPPVAAVRGVVDAAKESIAVFGKIVAVLRLQTPAFKDADVRYTRQLLLSIYGGMAEIAQAWRTMAPLLVEIKPILHTEPRGLAPPMSKSNSVSGGRTPISPIPESGENATPERPHRPLPSSGNLAAGAMPPVGTSPRGKSRRHAGSFSTEDVERGMLMGYPVSSAPRSDWPDLSRTIFEDNEAMADTAPPPFPLNAEPEPPHMTPPGPHREALPPIVTSFSQPARSRHAAMSSTGSSFLYAPNGGARSLSVDIRPPTPASATLYDEDLLDQIETATDIAFTVWLRLSEDIGGSSFRGKSDSISSATGFDRSKPLTTRQYTDLVRALSRAEQVTTTLRESLMGLRANPFAYAHPSLPDNAQGFIKQVVKVLEQVKQLSGHHTFSTPVRHALSQLSQATRECAILIQVSSLQPSAASSALNLADYRPDYHFGYKPEVFRDANANPNTNGNSTSQNAGTGAAAPAANGNSSGTASGTGTGTGSGSGSGGAMSSNEELPGLRGLHLPRARGLRERGERERKQ